MKNCEAKHKLNELSKFIPFIQRSFLIEGLFQENNAFAVEIVERLFSALERLPKTYETDGQGDKAIAYLHYFGRGFDFYITEKDINDAQEQAFGLASGDYVELGYISIFELVRNGLIELDFYFEPKSLKEIRAELNA